MVSHKGHKEHKVVIKKTKEPLINSLFIVTPAKAGVQSLYCDKHLQIAGFRLPPE